MASFESFDGLTLSFQDEGRGRTVVLLHGFAADSNINWVRSGLFDLLVDEGWRVVALDARGHGLSAKPHDSEAYSGDAMTRDVEALLDHLDLERCRVVGYSMGATTALRLAALEPRVHAAAVLGVGGATIAPERRTTTMGDGFVDALLVDDPAAITDPVGRQFRTLADSVRADREALAAYARSRSAGALDVVANITVPVLVVAGDDDELAGPPAELAARIAGATAVTVPGDHFTSPSHPQLHRAVLAFLDAN